MKKLFSIGSMLLVCMFLSSVDVKAQASNLTVTNNTSCYFEFVIFVTSCTTTGCTSPVTVCIPPGVTSVPPICGAAFEWDKIAAYTAYPDCRPCTGERLDVANGYHCSQNQLKAEFRGCDNCGMGVIEFTGLNSVEIN